MAMNSRTQELKNSRTNKFGRIGVLMGGPSSEREISLKSGQAVYEALKAEGLDAVDIDIATADINKNLALLKSKKIDCAFIAMHGRFGEDGAIQEILERLGLPYTGSGVLASRLAMDKIASRRIFEANGLSVPQYKEIKKETYRRDVKSLNGLKFPLVVKPATHGSSIGLSIVRKDAEFNNAIDMAFTFDERLIIDEYIEGREMTVGVLDEEPLPVIEVIPKKEFFDYEAKYTFGLTDYEVPARLDEEAAKKIKSAALSAHKLMGCFGCSRTDMILNRDGLPVILEVNTIPGLTATSLLPKAAKVTGISFTRLCLKLIELAYEKK